MEKTNPKNFNVLCHMGFLEFKRSSTQRLKCTKFIRTGITNEGKLKILFFAEKIEVK